MYQSHLDRDHLSLPHFVASKYVTIFFKSADHPMPLSKKPSGRPTQASDNKPWGNQKASATSGDGEDCLVDPPQTPTHVKGARERSDGLCVGCLESSFCRSWRWSSLSLSLVRCFTATAVHTTGRHQPARKLLLEPAVTIGCGGTVAQQPPQELYHTIDTGTID